MNETNEKSTACAAKYRIASIHDMYRWFTWEEGRADINYMSLTFPMSEHFLIDEKGERVRSAKELCAELGREPCCPDVATPCPQVAVPNAGPIPASAQAIPPRRFADGQRVQVIDKSDCWFEGTGNVESAKLGLCNSWNYSVRGTGCINAKWFRDDQLACCPKTAVELAHEKWVREEISSLGFGDQKPDLTAIRAKLWARVYSDSLCHPPEHNPIVGKRYPADHADAAVFLFDSRFDRTAKPEQPPAP